MPGSIAAALAAHLLSAHMNASLAPSMSGFLANTPLSPAGITDVVTRDINQWRTGRGLVPLAPNAGLASLARGWAGGTGSVYQHNPGLGAYGRQSGTRAVGEIMQSPPSNRYEDIHNLTSYWAVSPEHFAVMSRPGMNQIGVGIGQRPWGGQEHPFVVADLGGS